MKSNKTLACFENRKKNQPILKLKRTKALIRIHHVSVCVLKVHRRKSLGVHAWQRSIYHIHDACEPSTIIIYTDPKKRRDYVPIQRWPLITRQMQTKRGAAGAKGALGLGQVITQRIINLTTKPNPKSIGFCSSVGGVWGHGKCNGTFEKP